MKVGDYVRTKNKIGRIIKCNSIYFILDNDDNNIAHELDEIIESSPNIIDLIEVGDYVNGEKVIGKLDYLLEFDGGGDGDYYLREEEIKTIVTKEQFESVEYRIGE